MRNAHAAAAVIQACYLPLGLGLGLGLGFGVVALGLGLGFGLVVGEGSCRGHAVHYLLLVYLHTSVTPGRRARDARVEARSAAARGAAQRLYRPNLP